MANSSNNGGYTGFEPVTGDPWYGPVPPDPWYIADGSVIDVDEHFRVDMQIPVGLLEVIFSERAAQPAPNDRISWRSWFPGAVIPVAMFPCTDPASSSSDLVLHDVVDGLKLTRTSTNIFFRRLASGLYASDYRGRFCYNPIRGVEFTNTAAVETFVAGSKHDLDPPGVPVSSEDAFAISGFIVARLRKPGLLMRKRESGGKGWKLTVENSAGHEGRLRLTYFDGSDPTKNVWVEIAARHDTQHWFGALFSIEYRGGGSPYVKPRLFTPHGYYVDSGDNENAITNLTASPTPWPDAGADPVIDAFFNFGGAVGQISFASYWQGKADRYELATHNNYHRLWRGTVFPPDVAEQAGLKLKRNMVLGWPVGQTLGSGDAVVKFAPEGQVVPQDPFEEVDGERVLPHDKERKNLLIRSEDFSLWTGGLSDRETSSPDGMLGGYELKKGDTDLTATIDLDSPDMAHVFSIWARSRNGGSIILGFDDNGGEAVSSTTSLSKRWTRVFLVNEDPDNDPADVSIGAGGLDGSSVEIWGAQIQKGKAPTAYIPTTTSAETATFDDCKVDWGVLPGPPADHGKVQIILLPRQELVDTDGSFATFEFTDIQGNYLRAWGVVASDGNGLRTITWKGYGQLWDGNSGHWNPDHTIEAEPLVFEADQPLTVALGWNRYGIELWVENELAGKAGPPSANPDFPVSFEVAPDTCHFMREADGSNKWIGACKELRWWR